MAEGMFGGGMGTAANPYLIEDADDLNNIRNYLNCHFKLKTNINLGRPPYNKDKGWSPINGFTGSLDGNGKKIYNLYVNRPSDNNIGLFGSVNIGSTAARFFDLSLENVNLKGANNIGAVAGTVASTVNLSADTYWLFANISVSGKINGGSGLGALAGNLAYNAGNLYLRLARQCSSGVVFTPTGQDGYIGQFFGLTTSNNAGKAFGVFELIGTGSVAAEQALSAKRGYFCGDETKWNYDKVYFDADVWKHPAASPYGKSTEFMQAPGNFASFTKVGDKDGWILAAGEYPMLKNFSSDHLFICSEEQYYVYERNAWVMKYAKEPSKLQATYDGMKSLEHIPAAAWNKFKDDKDTVILNIIDKTDEIGTFSSNITMTRDAEHSGNGRNIFKKAVAVNSLSGILSTVHI